jgi:hypothetical protein
MRLVGKVGGLSATGVLLAVTILALTPIASATSAIFSLKGASPIISNSFQENGCATANAARPSFSFTTGVGHVDLSGMAKLCSKAKGGHAVSSSGTAYSELGVQKTMKLTRTYSYLNASWNVSASALITAVGSILKCPYTKSSFSYLTSNATGALSTVYVNETEQDCYAEAGVSISPELEICSANSCYGYGFAGVSYETGPYTENYTETVNYTSGAYPNGTYSCTTCYGNLGPSGTYSISAAPSASVTGSWAKGTTVTIMAFLFIDVFAEVYHANSAHASAVLNAKASVGHVAITSFTFT